MTPLIRKEIRLVLPYFGIALFLAAVPVWFPIIILRPSVNLALGVVSQSVFWAFALGAVLLGLAPFGQELSMGTFSVLLSEPCERRRIWNIKSLVVLAAMLLVFAVFLVSVHTWLDSSLNANLQHLESFQTWKAMQHEHKGGPIKGEIAVAGIWLPGGYVYAGGDHDRLDYPATESANRIWYLSQFSESCRFGCLLLVAAVTGGLWTTLLFRQIGAAIWFAILIPGALLMVVQFLFGTFSPHGQAIATTAIFVCYSVFGFAWARRMFLCAQDVQWLGGTISLTSASPAKARMEIVVARRRKPITELLCKELQLQQMSLLISFGLLVLHICALGYRKFGAPHTETRFVLEAVPCLWLLMPWLVGSAAVAEERKLGTLGNQMCLPFARGLQFLVKFLVVMVLGVVLGGICPWLIERLGLLFNVSSEMIHAHPTDDFLFLLALAASISGLSFYASTLTRNTLHALGATVVLGGVFFGLCVCLGLVANVLLEELLRSSTPAMLALFLWTAYANSKRLEVGRRLWLQNVSVLMCAFAVVLLLSAIFAPRNY